MPKEKKFRKTNELNINAFIYDFSGCHGLFGLYGFSSVLIL